MTEQEKQIEEMAILFAKEYCNPKGCDCCNLCDEYGSRDLNCEDWLGYKRMAKTFYEKGYRKERQGEWISVEDGLPQEDVRVLVAIDKDGNYTNIDTDRILDGKWVRWRDSVTHWQALPQPPKMKGADSEK